VLQALVSDIEEQTFVPYTLYIHIRVFLGLDPCVASFVQGCKERLVPWEIWGPQNTRWSVINTSSGCRPVSYGLKTVEPVLMRGLERMNHSLRIWDFNSYTLLAWQKGRVVTESTRPSHEHIFMQVVQSSLPMTALSSWKFQWMQINSSCLRYCHGFRRCY